MNLAEAAADWHDPSVVAIGFPIGGDDWSRDQVPAIRKVVIDEWFHQHLVDMFAVIISGKRPQLVHQHAAQPGLLIPHQNDRGTGAPLSLTQHIVGGAGELDDRAKAPSELAWLTWREETTELNV